MRNKYLALFLFSVLCSCLSLLAVADENANISSSGGNTGNGAAGGEGSDAASDVVTLTQSNFDSVVEANEAVLVKFYAPWCGHCKRMAPEYERAARKLKSGGSAVVLAQVDATAETELANKMQINEFPTITLFTRSANHQYTGGRTAEAIVEWIEMMTGPALIEVGEAEDVSERVNKESPVGFYGVFREEDVKEGKNELYNTFKQIANEERMLGKYYVKLLKGTEEGEKKEKVNAIQAIRYEEGVYDYEGDGSHKSLLEFIKNESYPLLGPINGDNFRRYIERDMSLVWLCASESEYNAYKESLRAAAKQGSNRELYTFVWLDTDSFKGHAEAALGVSTIPSLVVQTKKGRRYILKEAGEKMKDAAEVASFLQDVRDNKVERELKSDPVPSQEEEKDGFVRVVVGKSFEDLVLSSERDVFLQIYAPWCGYCKSFEPIYREFAEKLKDNAKVLVAKMDGTSNESPLDDFEWNSFPTVFFVKAGTQRPIRYEGSRTVEGLLEFFSKHASFPPPDAATTKDEL